MEEELKAGHPPAQKVGGMRVAQHKPRTTSSSESGDKDSKPTNEEKEEFGEDKPLKPASAIVVSGAVASEGTAYPAEAVKAFHDKPMPTHDKGGAAHGKPKIIHQPKKWIQRLELIADYPSLQKKNTTFFFQSTFYYHIYI